MIRLLENVFDGFKDLLILEAGQDLVEYALLVLLLCVGILVAVPPLAAALAPMFTAADVDL